MLFLSLKSQQSTLLCVIKPSLHLIVMGLRNRAIEGGSGLS